MATHNYKCAVCGVIESYWFEGAPPEEFELGHCLEHSVEDRSYQHEFRRVWESPRIGAGSSGGTPAR